MTDRYSYIKEFAELSKGHHAGAYQFAVAAAKN